MKGVGQTFERETVGTRLPEHASLKRIAVAGAGVLGSQIAFQAALHGCSVQLYDHDPARTEGVDRAIADLAAAYHRDTDHSDEALADAATRLSATTDLAEALRGAELVIEAVPEDIVIKQDFYRAASALAAPDTIFATNSSTLAPSAIAPSVERPERFLALHFANQIWIRNIAEIMGHAETDPAVFAAVVAFAREIGMIPLELHQEQPGYVINSLLVPLLESALTLAAKGVADAHTIDRTWMIATGAPRGPFGILDVVGMRTSYQLALAKAEAGDPAATAMAAWLKSGYIDQNKLGVETGEGFYRYPGPRYRDADFLAA